MQGSLENTVSILLTIDYEFGNAYVATSPKIAWQEEELVLAEVVGVRPVSSLNVSTREWESIAMRSAHAAEPRVVARGQAQLEGRPR